MQMDIQFVFFSLNLHCLKEFQIFDVLFLANEDNLCSADLTGTSICTNAKFSLKLYENAHKF